MALRSVINVYVLTYHIIIYWSDILTTRWLWLFPGINRWTEDPGKHCECQDHQPQLTHCFTHLENNCILEIQSNLHYTGLRLSYTFTGLRRNLIDKIQG